jgi:hypothetical protein
MFKSLLLEPTLFAVSEQISNKICVFLRDLYLMLLKKLKDTMRIDYLGKNESKLRCDTFSLDCHYHSHELELF